MSKLYKEAEQFLITTDKHGSLQNRIFAAAKGKKIQTNPKHIFALVSSTLKYKKYLLEIIKKSQLLKLEKNITEPQALLLTHDLLLSKSGRIQMGKTPLKEAVLKHKTRLTAEYVKLKLKHKVKDLSALVEDDDTPVRWFRVNTLKITHIDTFLEKHFSHLTEVNSISKIKPGTIYKDQYIPNLYGIHPTTKLTSMHPYVLGQVIIQDRASCFPAHMLNPSSEEKVIDACAAPGNKTTHLATYVKNAKGQINAFERDIKRAGILKHMVERAGASSVTVNVGDFTQSNPTDFPLVTGMVVDPSCSGSGIFGRAYDEDDKEESYSEERLLKLSAFQATIVKHAMSFPAVQRIVYSTCSIHAQENERVVVDLLNDEKVKERGWRVANRSRVIPMWPRRGLVEEFQGKVEFPERVAGGCVRAMPKEDGGIGFFAVLFERDASEEELKLLAEAAESKKDGDEEKSE
ncbi:hypothetical protein WICPIJ_004021 [Wickerhamomyces pijperi]|uniref:SAM-dependent MTase RsmB/NOP-type domain-containing protein n=1 Tax=Wickerhamomyces pijperi TaxID=599730 RepID=A0A9P8Q8U6_WICPI|nr:hypothetical protein WICPIJ_004021 [Wickerhamomyces pijperi]